MFKLLFLNFIDNFSLLTKLIVECLQIKFQYIAPLINDK